jgi:hypothetical protein
MISKFIISSFFLMLISSCIKPYACECEYVKEQPVKTSHVLVYANKQNKDEACGKNNKDSTVVCHVKE